MFIKRTLNDVKKNCDVYCCSGQEHQNIPVLMFRMLTRAWFPTMDSRGISQSCVTETTLGNSDQQQLHNVKSYEDLFLQFWYNGEVYIITFGFIDWSYFATKRHNFPWNISQPFRMEIHIYFVCNFEIVGKWTMNNIKTWQHHWYLLS